MPNLFTFLSNCGAQNTHRVQTNIEGQVGKSLDRRKGVHQVDKGHQGVSRHDLLSGKLCRLSYGPTPVNLHDLIIILWIMEAQSSEDPWKGTITPVWPFTLPGYTMPCRRWRSWGASLEKTLWFWRQVPFFDPVQEFLLFSWNLPPCTVSHFSELLSVSLAQWSSRHCVSVGLCVPVDIHGPVGQSRWRDKDK